MIDPLATCLGLVGYGSWPVAKRVGGLIATLQASKINLLVDVRLQPCSSDAGEGRAYGPKPWNLQANGKGIAPLMAEAGIGYEWIVELGNPQRQDPAMAVLKEHLADESIDWPVHRGLKRLALILHEPGRSVALLCACEDGARCHRAVVARALNERHFDGRLIVGELPLVKPRG